MNSQPETDPESQIETAEQPPPAPAENAAEELEKYKDAALRARADLDNYRKRVAREKEEAIRYANNSLIEKLLPILDNFELGLDAARNASDAAGIIQGLEMVRKQLEDFLRENGVEVVNAVGRRLHREPHLRPGERVESLGRRSESACLITRRSHDQPRLDAPIIGGRRDVF